MLFLDEPTTGLDPRSRNQIWDSIRELVRQGTTLLLTTQYLEEADQLTDRIAVIDHGGVIAEGTGDELKDSVGGQMIEARLASSGGPPPGDRGSHPARLRDPRAVRVGSRADAAGAGGRDHHDRGSRLAPSGRRTFQSPIWGFAGPRSTTSSSP